MKKGLIIGLAVMGLLMMAPSAVLAIDIDIDADPTITVATLEATLSWDGVGCVDIDALVRDDDRVGLRTGGDHIFGSLYLKDAGEEYGVSKFSTHIDAGVKNGVIQYVVDKLDAYNGYEKHGPLNRSSKSYISATKRASLSLNVYSDYGKFLDYDGNFVAKGEYLAFHSVANGIGRNVAYFEAGGKGTLDLHHERDTTIGNNDFAPVNFGAGLYYYSEKSHVTQTGRGYFQVGGHFENTVSGGYIWDFDLDKTADPWDKTPSWTATGSVDYMARFDFSHGFSLMNYSFGGK